MPKTLIITDSACDISPEEEARLGIKVLNIPIAIGGQSYRDRADIVGADFIAQLDSFAELPKTSQITVFEYYEAYLEAAHAGYASIITVCINAGGSGCYSAAGHAVEMLTAEHPDIAAQMDIHVVDGGSYTLAVAWPIPQAIVKLEAGEPAAAVAEWLRELYINQVTLIGLTNLSYPKRSGRLNSSAAVVGDALGIKPILSVYKGANTVADKCRGEKNLIPRMVALYQQCAADRAGDYVVAYGTDRAFGDALAAAIEEVCGRPPVAMGQIGPLIALNSGPRIVGMAFRRKPE